MQTRSDVIILHKTIGIRLFNGTKLVKVSKNYLTFRAYFRYNSSSTW